MPAKLPRLLIRLFGVAAAFALLAAPGSDRGLAAPALAKITTVYRINFAGINLGKVKFRTNVSGTAYAVEGAGKLEFLGGVIWRLTAGTQSKGAMTSGGPRPASFSFRFENGKKHGKLAMKFEGNAVRDVDSDIPDAAKHPRYIPVSRADMTGVLDPLSALFLGAKGDGETVDPTVCDTRVPVFDGKHRFDLQLSHKKTVRVKPKGDRGYAGPAVICRVRYIPISGYKTSQDAIRFLSQSDDIEVWLIPVAKAGVYLPYHVSVPTLYGSATATSALLQVERDSKLQTVVND